MDPIAEIIDSGFTCLSIIGIMDRSAKMTNRDRVIVSSYMLVIMAGMSRYSIVARY